MKRMRRALWRMLSRKHQKICLGCNGQGYWVENVLGYIHQKCCKLCGGRGSIRCYEEPTL